MADNTVRPCQLAGGYCHGLALCPACIGGYRTRDDEWDD